MMAFGVAVPIGNSEGTGAAGDPAGRGLAWKGKAPEEVAAAA